MLHKRKPFLRVLLNPLVLSLAVVLALTAGWLLYIGGGSSIAQARPGANLLPALDSAPSGAASAPDGTISGWELSHSGDAETSLTLVDGQLNDHALKLEIPKHTLGDVTLSSPRVDVVPGETYLFKSYTTSEADFTLLLRRHHTDGSTSLEQLPNPVERPSNSLFTVSDAFTSTADTTTVQYVFRLASPGALSLEGAYFETAKDVRVPSSPTLGTPAVNLIPNPELTGPQSGAPHSWSTYTSGTSSVKSGLSQDTDGSYLWTSVANHRDGEAKWQHEPIPVTKDQYLQFGASYQSEREVELVAEFELADGDREFQSLATLPPAGEWTQIGESFQVPDKAKTVTVTLVSHQNGTNGVRDFTLRDITQPGPLRWEKPMVSITFDDGWQSVYESALPLLDQHNFRSTQYVNATTIETPGFMTAAELQEMHEAGHEIASHSYNHVDLTSIGADRLNEEMRKSKESLADAGLATENIAPPYGRSDPQVDWHADQYFETVRGTDVGINTRQNLDTHDLKVFYVHEETTQECLAEALAQTAKVNGWLIVVYHQIEDAEPTSTSKNSVPADGSTVPSDVLAAQLQLIDASGIEVKTLAKAFEQLQDQ